MQVIDRIGYDAVDMGSLADSWRSEPTTPVYVFPYIAKSQEALTPGAAESYFMRAPGAIVSSEQVKALLARAVRHDKMHGYMAAFRESLQQAVGSAVTKFKTGDIVAVGCMVDSDGTTGFNQANRLRF